MKRIFGALVMLVTGLLVAGGDAQAQSKVALEVLHSGTDAVGVRYAYEMKELIRKSGRMRMVQASDKAERVQIRIISMPYDRERPDLSSVISVAITVDGTNVPLNGYYITTYVVSCGSSKVANCAAGLIADMDKDLDRVEREWPALWGRVNRE